MTMAPADRRALRAALVEVAPWLERTDVGPRAVEAGNCDRCDTHPRLLPTCGPAGAEAVCRACATALSDDGWCDGHRDEGHAARAWAATLPERWSTYVVLWWVATGEVTSDPTDVDTGELPEPIAARFTSPAAPRRRGR